MNARDEGGPAFPVTSYDQQTFSPSNVLEMRRLLSGMTLRDYFAAQFMARAQSLSEDRNGGWDYDNVANCAYAMADAMLAKRQEPKR